MTKRILLSLILWGGVVFCALGYNFSAVNEGQTIYYNITDAENHYVEVTYNTTNYDSYSGAIVVPSTVTNPNDDIEYTVTAVGESAFRRKYQSGSGGRVTSVTLPNTILTIGDNAFYYGYTYLTSVNIPEHVTSIGNYAFYYCSGLTSISIPNSVTSIGNNAFQSCTAATAITIGNNVESIGNDAFKFCNGLTSISIPNSVTSIGNNAFQGCSAATTITIGNNVESIGNEAFKSCSKITSITIPNSVTILGNSVFESCVKLVSVTIGTSISSIPNGTFKSCSATGFTSITLPNNITSVGENAFSGCSKLTTVSGSEVTTISNSSFYNCTSLTTINLPKMSTIGTDAFYGCTALTSLSIPNTVTSINTNPFQKCTALTTITVDAGNTTYNSGSGNNCIIRTADNTLMVGCKSTTIPESVTSIGNNAFRECTGITSVDLLKVTAIEDNAFYGCSNLANLTFGNDLRTIGNNAFTNCNKLTTLALPNGITSIGSYAFQGCNLSQIIIPASVTIIGNNAFKSNSTLATVIMMGATPPAAGTLVFLKTGYSYSDANMPNIYVLSGNVDENTTIEQAYKAASNWNTWANKISSTIGSDILLNTSATIPDGCTLDMNGHTLTIGASGSLTIADGGQLAVNSSGVQATFQKEIEGYTNNKDRYYLIANPTTTNIAPSDVENMLLANKYDLFYFDESEEGAEWRNYKQEPFDLENGKGYLYANDDDVTLAFVGTAPTGTSASITLNKTDENTYAGFNLVGNPMSVNITSMYIGDSECSYYKLNPTTGVFSASTATIIVGEAFMVQADENGATLNLNPGSKDESSFNNEVIRLEVSNNKYTDVAYLYFGNHLPLTKINHLNDEAPMLYIHSEKADQAVAVINNRSEVKSVNVNFEAKVMGSYTISGKAEKGNFSYMHLYDRLTGTDTDLLNTDYTFIGSKTDAAGRFILRFEAIDNNSESESFAYQNGSDIIINGEGELQIFDVMGRMVSTKNVNGRETINVSAQGVYIFRLNGMTQKIVVK